MENLLVSINVVLPLFLIMILGYVLRQCNIWDDQTLSVMNRVCFRFFLPVMLFENIYQTDIERAFNPRLMLFAAVSELILFTVLFLLIPLFEKDNRRRGVLIQGMYRSNFILFGVPVSIALLGKGNAGCTSVLIAVVIPIYNILAVLVLEYFRGSKVDFKVVARGIASNPLIWGAVVAGVVKGLGLVVPQALQVAMEDVGSLATPLALMVLGGSFHFKAVQGYTRQLTAAVLARLLLIPAIFLTISIAMGFRRTELIALLCMFGAPTAVSSFTMAEQMGGDGELAGQIVVFTSAFSIFSMFLWVFLFKQFGYIA